MPSGRGGILTGDACVSRSARALENSRRFRRATPRSGRRRVGEHERLSVVSAAGLADRRLDLERGAETLTAVWPWSFTLASLPTRPRGR